MLMLQSSRRHDNRQTRNRTRGDKMSSESKDVEPSRRAFLVRFAGAAFAAPVIASFALDGMAQASERGKPQDNKHGKGNPKQCPPNQGHPNQGNPNQGNPNQGNPNQGNPNQGRPNQGYPNQGNPNQGHPNQGFPNQGNPNQGPPKHGHPKQCNPNQSNPNQTLPDSAVG